MNNYNVLARKFRKQIEKDWGEKCKEFNFGCIVCQAHRIVDDLEELGNFLDDMDKIDNKRSKHNHKRA
jgi:hypothetical protein